MGNALVTIPYFAYDYLLIIPQIRSYNSYMYYYMHLQRSTQFKLAVYMP